jgi:hypothetical protein
MYLAGSADEAAVSIDEQIRSARKLGRSNINRRQVNGKALANLDDAHRSLPRAAAMLVLLASLGVLAGCPNGRHEENPVVAAPLLPREIRLHPFTGTRTFDPTGGLRGVEARVEVINHLGEPTNAFGSFLFMLYAYRPREADPRGQRLDTWEITLNNARQNLQYWDSLSRTYKFPLVLREPLPVGKQAVLEVYFQDPVQPEGSPRLFDRRVFISGE